MTIGQIYGVLTFGVLAVNVVASRFARNCGPVNLSVAFFVAWGITNFLRWQAPLPWAWIPGGIIDLGLLMATVWVGKHVKSVWAWWLAATLVIGLIVQVDLWVSWWPHRSESYKGNWTLFHIYDRYWWCTMVLSSVEIGLLVWPGGRILVGPISRWIDDFYGLPHRRRFDI